MKIPQKFSVSIILSILLSSQLFAQDEEIRRKQRAIFIYNITQQVAWANPGTFVEFKIAVLGDDPLLGELKGFEKGRKVRGKDIKVQNFFTIDEIKNVQLIYVHKRFGYDIAEVLERVSGDDVLIVSEDYGFNESMINMIEIGNTFQFEVNQARLELENFTIARSFLDLAISSADTWQDLYLASYESLQNEREKVSEQRKLLEEQTSRLFAQQGQLAKQRVKIDGQTTQIEARNIEVERLRIEFDALASRNEEQKRQFAENKNALAEASRMLESQKKGIEERKEEIERLDRMLLQQMDQISNKESEIDLQKSRLEQQSEKLDYQRSFTTLLIILTLSTVTAGFFIWRSYRIKKKSNLSLAKKNQEIKDQAKELALKNQELEQFAYIASHDLQEPLNTIMAIAKIIPTDKLEDRDRQSLDFISEAATRMRQLIRGLLEYSRLGRDVTFSKVNCAMVMDNVKANLTQRLEETKTILHVGELPSLKGHEVEITLLFQNLVTNAMKFVAEGVTPEITIGAEKVKQKGKRTKKWQFHVKDNGIGIDEKFLEKVFIIFKRLNAKNKYEGTGLGLAHCKKIVDLHDGTIWVESEVGKGSTFYFTLG